MLDKKTKIKIKLKQNTKQDHNFNASTKTM